MIFKQIIKESVEQQLRRLDEDVVKINFHATERGARRECCAEFGLQPWTHTLFGGTVTEAARFLENERLATEKQTISERLTRP